MPARSERMERKGLKGFSSVMRTVSGSTTSTAVTRLISLRRGEANSRSSIRSKLYFTASALNGVPSWKTTLGRSRKV
jgi:hypothetical protein